jgi:hypothetical protein
MVLQELTQGILKGDWFGISSMTTGNFCLDLQNRLTQTSQTGGQWYSASPFNIPWLTYFTFYMGGLTVLPVFTVEA